MVKKVFRSEVRPPSGSTSVVLCIVSVTAVCVCFSLLLLQSQQIKNLSADLMDLKTKVEKANQQTEQTSCCCGVAGRRTFLHLQALSSHSHDEDDHTLLKWSSAWSQGDGLLVSGETVTVVTEGLYFIYSQVLYKSTTWVMGHVITKRLNGTDTKIMKCLKNMPDNISIALNSCYTAGIFFLESGTVLELSIPRKSADLVLTPHSTFFGIFSL